MALLVRLCSGTKLPALAGSPLRTTNVPKRYECQEVVAESDGSKCYVWGFMLRLRWLKRSRFSAHDRPDIVGAEPFLVESTHTPIVPKLDGLRKRHVFEKQFEVIAPFAHRALSCFARPPT